MNLVYIIFSGLMLNQAAIAEVKSSQLTLDTYIGQVTSEGIGYKAAQQAADGYELMSKGESVVTFPYLFGSYKNTDDRQEKTIVVSQGNRTTISQYAIGLGSNTPIGLNAKYSYVLANTDIMGATAITTPKFYNSYNQLELTQSLLKNGFGSETRAQQAIVRSKNMAESYANQFSAINQLVGAEAVYWRLAFARRSVEVQKDVLARAEKVLEWAKRRVSLQLGDKADRLQAQASYDLRRMELMALEDEEKSASLAFNTLRNRDDSLVSEKLFIPSIEKTLNMNALEKTGTRLDVKAAEQQKEALVASSQLEKEKLKPTVDVFANIAWTGFDSDRGRAVSESFEKNHSNIAVGVSFSIPLQISAVTKGIQGAGLTQEAAQYSLEQKRLDEARDWKEIQNKLNDAKKRLQLLSTVESIQKEKYEHEQERLLRGRTTTYQALSFEQDYAATQLTTLRTQSEVLQLLARMKLYQGE
ncbi:MAG: TolC family protein [Oligoflexia bacterium]|nr:TolC family protein [Oligoflexia bacterium]